MELMLDVIQSIQDAFHRIPEGLFFLLIGTCGAYSGGLLGVAYLTSIRSLALGHRQLCRALLFVGVHEFSFSLFLFDKNLLAIVSIAAGCAVQFVASRVGRQPETVTAHMLRTYAPGNEGPREVGKIFAIMIGSVAFLLWATPLRELSVWHKLLFTVPTPISTYFAISLLAMPRTRSE